MIQNEIRADEIKKGWFFPQLFIIFFASVVPVSQL